MNVAGAPFRRFYWSALVLMLVLLAGCTGGSSSSSESPTRQPPDTPSGGPSSSPPDDAVAVVGGVTITRAELVDRLLDGYGAEVLRELMLREAVNREAERLGVTVSGEELDGELRRMSEGYGSEADFYASMQQQLGMNRAAVREDARHRLLLEKLATRNVDVPEADIRKYYEEHRREYGPRKQYELVWILTVSEEAAASVLSRLENGQDFGELAKRYSADAMTAENGGDLGWVDELDPLQDPKLITAAGGLQVGEAAGPIQTDQGYAVLQLNGIKTVQGKDYESVREEIRRQLAMEQAPSLRDVEQSLLDEYGAKTLDPRLRLPSNR
ncbi:hypothetical protein GE107_23555 [Cohnella sp. CFH 77786]|uniref:peptidyl-prolyl cis-trans isomerase n=1 Tax=Cohnella sp. CFH 77786 TaxID=2662265 RepID=UPI001C60BA3A|nr:peptidyl-prolyl cis-trans isomerase [Cohnella sp. CFH 77786]MBW5449011.1 hypothetical protein [Cohnella sp. CFH 77786]